VMGRRRLAWLLSGQLLLPGPATTGPQQAARIRNVQVVVPASTRAWRDAGIVASTGDLIVTMAEGRVVVTVGELSPAAAREPLETWTVDADGIRGSRTEDGTLQMQVGAGAITAVGARSFNFVNDSGPVRFRVRSSHPERNGGSFTVRVLCIPASLIPRATPGLPPPVD
jgi:hypothetical protein